MNLRLAVNVTGLMAGVLALTPEAKAQDDAERGCRAHAALSTGAVYEDIYVQRGRVINRGSGNFELTWEAWVADDRALTGRCEADVRGAVILFQRVSEHGGRKPNSSSSGLGSISLETTGNGNFSGLGMNGPIDRAHVLLREGKATVTFIGGANRINITGNVTASPGRGTGSGTSAQVSTSGPPGVGIVIARMPFLTLCPGPWQT